jgi:aminomethyltransferase
MPDQPGVQPNRSPLYDSHVSAGARMVVRDGWEVPADYGQCRDECIQLHTRAAVMDLTADGRIRVRGDGALGMLERLCTADVARQEDDTAIRSLLLNQRGCVIDMVTVMRLDGWWVLTCSPSRRQAVLEHLQSHAGQFDAEVDDQTFKTATLAVVGPMGAEILDRFLPDKASGLAGGAVRVGSMLIANYIAARTGATDLWSLEVTLPNMLAGQAWKFITAKAGQHALSPAGMDAREVLRIEARLPRWGNEMDDGTEAVSAGLAAMVCFEKDFLGADAVGTAGQAPLGQAGGQSRRVAWSMEAGAPACPGRAGPQAGIARGDKLLDPGGRVIGTVTSAAFSPSCNTWLGQGRSEAGLLGTGSLLAIETAAGQRHFVTVTEAF